jgi:hypothetical protein
MRKLLQRACAALVSAALVVPPAFAQAPPPAPSPASLAPAPQGAPAATTANGDEDAFSAEQLDALLAPIALYPDTLLVQVLMAATNPLQIVEAARWLGNGANKDLQGDALAKALEPLNWDPSVKSIVPFPMVLDMMNQQLQWTQQLGYAVTVQQDDVMDSVQRLRHQAQDAGTLKTTEQAVVRSVAITDDQGAPTSQQAIVIEPANPQVVFVPVYNPTVAFGTWPYAATPPVYFPPPPGYAIGTALATGIAFAAGAAVVGSLWGWATPRWGWGGNRGYGGWGGNINVNRNRYTNISVNNINRGNFNGNNWRPSNGNRPGGGFTRPPGGPVGTPRRGNGLGANAVGRPSVRVPSQTVNRPNISNRPGGTGGLNRPNNGSGGYNRPNAGPAGGGNRPNVGQGGGGNRPNVGQGGGGNRPNVGQGGGGNRPNVGQGGGGNRPNVGQGAGGNRPAQVQRPSARPQGGGAFGGVQQGARAGQLQQRGAQSRNIQQSRPAARPAQRPSGGGGGRPGGGGGARAGGGGGGRGGRH